MGSYTILRNTKLEIDLNVDYQDGGWSLVNGSAVHEQCNEGWFISSTTSAKAGIKYSLIFTTSGMSEGSSVIVRFGGVNTVIYTNGEHKVVIESISEQGLRVFSKFDVILSPVVISEGDISYRTLLYNPKGIFDSFISFDSDFMHNMFGSFYSFKNGSLWKHNSNPVKNSFYGNVEKSVIKFVLNPEPRIIKNLSHVKINGNRMWDVMDIFVYPYDGKPRGQKSRLKKNRFESLQGDFHAVFLKDMSDPRFTDKIQALFEGADLQGKIIEVTMEVGGFEDLRLVSLDFTYSNSNYTY